MARTVTTPKTTDTKKIQEVNIFMNAPVLAAPVATPKPSKRSNRAEREIKSLDAYAAVATLMKALEGLKKTLEPEVKDQVMDFFVSDAKLHSKKPESFHGIDEHSKASCELHRRKSNQPLTEEEVKILQGLNLPTETIVSTPAMEQRFVINTAELTQGDLAELSKAITSVPSLAGKQIVYIQPAQEEVKKEIVSDATLNQAAATIKNTDTLKQIMNMCASVVLKPMLEDADVKVAFKILEQAGITF
jgi:hypothetical protein